MRLPLFIIAFALTLPLLDRPADPAAPRHAREHEEREEAGAYPSDWFGAQRAFPLGEIPQEKFQQAVDQAQVQKAPAGFETEASTLEWTPAGPYNIGGRVTALAVVPGGTTIYLGAANGGVFKSLNSGVNWTPIMDGNWVYSVGALALDPTNSSHLIVGTGEANSAIDTYDGRGVFETFDGGVSWAHLGLTETARIGRVAIDPSNPQRIFVAAMGKQFSTGPNRGLYRSENGGASWTKVLFVNDSTGVCDVVINPAHPETVYAASWERIRRPSYRRVWGPGSGVWRSTNSGTTWTRLLGATGIPNDANVGRIGLAFAPSRPSWIYAQIVDASGDGRGLYRSTNGGANWTRRDIGVGFTDAFFGFGWYFGDVKVHPTNPDIVYALGGDIVRSTDGGVNFAIVTGEAHVDQHAMWIDPSNPSHIYAGNDGGFFWTTDNAVNWIQTLDLPITQFYAGAIDPSNPARLLGGTQDNNTLITAGSPTAWNWILGGDGFYCLVDPTNPNILFAEYQYCAGGSGPQRSTDGGASFSSPAMTLVGADRFNWNTPIVMDPNNHNILLTASQYVYRSTDNGLSYAAISPNLTTNPTASLVYGTVTTLDISKADGNTYYAGTDDGRVWRSTNAGGAWAPITAGLPVRWVTRVTADPVAPATVYVTLSGFSQDELASHVYRSTNRGTTWTNISSNLPNVPANDILVDPTDTQTLYVATDVGVYATRNRGQSWFPLARGIPMQTTFDLTLHSASRTLVAATHGRSQWKLDLAPLPTAVDPVARPAALRLAAPAPNPSRAGIETSLEVSAASRIEVSIYDAAGRRVRTLLDRSLEPGRHPISWDGTDERRVRRPGVFFLRAITREGDAVRRITLID